MGILTAMLIAQGGSANPAKTAAFSWTFQPHLSVWLALAFAGLGFAFIVKNLAATYSDQDPPVTARQKALMAAGLLCLVLATTWPLSDLATKYSLLARMGQNLLVCLGAPGFFLAGIPRWLLRRLSAGDVAYRSIRAITRPSVAIVIFNVVIIGSQTPVVVSATTRSGGLHGLDGVLLFLSGCIMWAPALRVFPGSRPSGTAGRVGYLFFQSLIPNFVSLVYIFARHPLYRDLATGARRLGLNPLTDQQLAGAMAKLVGVFVLWGSATFILFRSSKAEEAGLDPEPLTWEDVNRELRRLERKHRHVDHE